METIEKGEAVESVEVTDLRTQVARAGDATIASYLLKTSVDSSNPTINRHFKPRHF
jgi:hypothetical protein